MAVVSDSSGDIVYYDDFGSKYGSTKYSNIAVISYAVINAPQGDNITSQIDILQYVTETIRGTDSAAQHTERDACFPLPFPLSSRDSTATMCRCLWVTGRKRLQAVQCSAVQ